MTGSVNLIASVSRRSEDLVGTEAPDVFLIREGRSEGANRDTILNWQSGDIINLAHYNLDPELVDVQLVRNDAYLRLFDTSRDSNFQLLIDLGDNSADDVLESIYWGEGTPDMVESELPPAREHDIFVATDAVETFSFEEGDSVTGAIDVIVDIGLEDVIDLSAAGLRPADVEYRLLSDGTLKIIEGFEAGDFQLKVILGDLTVEDVQSLIVWGDVTGPAFDSILATDAAETFAFEDGDSVTGAIDIIVGLDLDDTIDLSSLGLSPDNIELRFVGDGGGILKLIDGFGEGDFQLKILLGDLTAGDVLSIIDWDAVSDLPDGKDNITVGFDFSAQSAEPPVEVLLINGSETDSYPANDYGMAQPNIEDDLSAEWIDDGFFAI